MPKKFVPDPNLLNMILTRYRETKNYSLVSRETGLSTVVIKRIISEQEKEQESSVFSYTELPPIEETKPVSKAQFYYKLQLLIKEKLNV